MNDIKLLCKKIKEARNNIFNSTLAVFATIFATMGLISFLFIIFNDAYFNTSFSIDTQLSSDFGDFFRGFVGTIFSTTSVLLLVYSIAHQNKENRKNDIKNT